MYVINTLPTHSHPTPTAGHCFFPGESLDRTCRQSVLSSYLDQITCIQEMGLLVLWNLEGEEWLFTKSSVRLSHLPFNYFSHFSKQSFCVYYSCLREKNGCSEVKSPS